MEKTAIIVAAGSGSRMNSEVPKQFLTLRNKPLLYYTIQAFLSAFEEMRFILVLPEAHIGKGQEVVDGFFDPSKFRFCAGGRTRFHSVQNGLKLIDPAVESILFIHDGVRCFVSPSLIQRCYEEALEYGTSIPVVASRDSVRLISDKEENETIERNRIRLVQTPQTFHSKILIPAYQIDYKEHFTDEAAVVESYGLKLHLTEGDYANIKITNPWDLQFAEFLLLERS